MQQWVGLWRFATELRRVRPDAVLPYTMYPNVVCGITWRWTGARTCIWNQRDEGIVRAEGMLERWAVHGTPWFVANSERGREFLVQKLHAAPRRVALIPNGVEAVVPLLDRAAWRSKLQVADDCFLACMVANLSPFKAHATLLMAWRMVVDRLSSLGRSAVLLLAGRRDGAYDSLAALTHDLRLNEDVRFLGHVADVSGLLSSVELAVLSSRSEGCPNSVLEAMAAGLAVVGTDTAGIRDALGIHSSSWLAPPGDADTLADRILRLALDPGLRATLGARNRMRVENEFSAPQTCARMVGLLSRALA